MPAPGAGTIAGARRSPNGRNLTIEGVVSAGTGIYDARGQRAYIQDSGQRDRSGIQVFLNSGGLPRLSAGDRIAVTGITGAFNSEKEIKPDTAAAVKLLGKEPVPEPLVLKSGDVIPDRDGLLATLSGGVSGTMRKTFFLDDGSGAVQVILPSSMKTDPLKDGDAATVTGITSISDGLMQLLPRGSADVVAVGQWRDPERADAAQQRQLATDPAETTLVIAAAYPHTYQNRVGEAAEAVRIQNTGTVPVNIEHWGLSDNKQVVTFPAYTLQPGQRIWVTRDSARFMQEFGAAPDLVYGEGDARTPRLSGTPLAFANSGGEVVLLDAGGAVVDALVYGAGDTTQPGWSGPAVQPYRFDTFVPPAGQVFYRKLDQASGRPLPNTHRATDWAQDPADPVDGHKLLYAGWSLDSFSQPAAGTEQATTTFFLAPDNAFEAMASLIDGAHSEIDIEIYTFSNPFLLDHLLRRQAAGVKVKALFDGRVFGSPDGSYDEDRWTAQQIVAHGGLAWFWSDATIDHLPARYNNHHQKFVVVDGKRVLITSGNFEQTTMPADDKRDGTAGNRDTGVITDAPGVVKRAQAIFDTDADPRRHDVQPVPMDFSYPAPKPRGNQTVYTVQRPTPLTVSGSLTYEVIQSPETSLRTVDELIGMVNRAGKGDEVLVEQQYEYAHWGADYENPRLAAYIAAARRGASVRILLDAANDSSGESERTVALLRGLASQEHLDIEGRQGKPSGGPIHNKLVMVKAGNRDWVSISSVNGSENASVFNRELGLQVQSNDAFRYFAPVFAFDWRASGGQAAIDLDGPSAPEVQLAESVVSSHLHIRVTAAAGEAPRAAEAFADVDPGSGKGTPLKVSGQPAGGGIAGGFRTDRLSEGVHTLYVRTRDAAGAWSATTAATFRVLRQAPESLLTIDPTSGGFVLAAAGSYTVDSTVSPPTIAGGEHTYTVTDAAGNRLALRIVVDRQGDSFRARLLDLRENGGGAHSLAAELSSVAGSASAAAFATATADDATGRATYNADGTTTFLLPGQLSRTVPGQAPLGLRIKGGRIVITP